MDVVFALRFAHNLYFYKTKVPSLALLHPGAMIFLDYSFEIVVEVKYLEWVEATGEITAYVLLSEYCSMPEEILNNSAEGWEKE